MPELFRALTPPLIAAIIAIWIASWQGLPYLVLLVAICTFAAEFLMRRTRYGAQLYAIGGNPEAARLSGINLTRAIFWNFVIAGFGYGITGVALTARVSGAIGGSAGLFLELDAIAAAIIGGTSLSGGRGRVLGALLGALLMGSLNNGMSLMNVPTFYQDTARGIILLLAVTIDQLSRRRSLGTLTSQKIQIKEWNLWIILPASSRYDQMVYRQCGRSGLKLPALSLGLWHNFGHDVAFETGQAICRRAFDLGITHFDLANNYGPPPGAAEETFAKILRTDFSGHRDELVISTKAGYLMWPGPYGEFGSRKYMLASLDQSLKRLGLDYVDIFYSHRFDPATPLEETMGALATAVHSGKALYVGVSSYSAARTADAAAILRAMGVNPLIHQPSYSMLNRWIEADHLLDRLATEGMGCIAFTPLAQGLLTNKYVSGIPAGSRATANKTLRPEFINEQTLTRIKGLNRDCPAPRPVFGTNGHCLGAA